MLTRQKLLKLGKVKKSTFMSKLREQFTCQKIQFFRIRWSLRRLHKKYLVYQKALIRTFHTVHQYFDYKISFEFTKREHKNQF